MAKRKPASARGKGFAPRRSVKTLPLKNPQIITAPRLIAEHQSPLSLDYRRQFIRAESAEPILPDPCQRCGTYPNDDGYCWCEINQRVREATDDNRTLLLRYSEAPRLLDPDPETRPGAVDAAALGADHGRPAHPDLRLRENNAIFERAARFDVPKPKKEKGLVSNTRFHGDERYHQPA